MMRSRAIGLTALAAWLVLAVAAPLAAQSAAVGSQMRGDPTRPPDGHFHEGEIGQQYLEIEHHIRCNCSCGLDVHMCQFRMSCDVSPVWSQRILRSLQAGDTPEAIEASFVSDFGGTVLMLPPPEGFNLVGYFLPMVAIVSAGMLIGLLVRGSPSRALANGGREIGEEEEARIRDALRQLDESEGPDW